MQLRFFLEKNLVVTRSNFVRKTVVSLLTM